MILTKGTLMLDANRAESVNHFLSSDNLRTTETRNLSGQRLQAAANMIQIIIPPQHRQYISDAASSHGYLLRRVPTAFVPCASSPSSSSAPASSPSWRRRGSSPQIPAAGQNGGCTGTGLVEIGTFFL